MSDVAEAFESQRPRLFWLAYRLLGSASEAEDAVQDAYLRLHAADVKAIESLPAWLTTAVTHLCLNRLTSARARREVYAGPWLPEPVLTDDRAPGPLDTAEQRESVSIALLSLMERLGPLSARRSYSEKRSPTATSRSPRSCRRRKPTPASCTGERGGGWVNPAAFPTRSRAVATARRPILYRSPRRRRRRTRRDLDRRRDVDGRRGWKGGRRPASNLGPRPGGALCRAGVQQKRGAGRPASRCRRDQW